MLQTLNATNVTGTKCLTHTLQLPISTAAGETKGSHYALVKETFPREVESGWLAAPQ